MAKTGSSSSQITVLYAEGDEQVLNSQADAMRRAGYHVEPTMGRKGTEEALRRTNVDLVVLGATLTRNDRHHLPYMAKKAQPGARVLVLHTDGEHHPAVEGTVDTGRSMDNVLEKMASMMSQGGGKTPMVKTAVAGK